MHAHSEYMHCITYVHIDYAVNFSANWCDTADVYTLNCVMVYSYVSGPGQWVCILLELISSYKSYWWRFATQIHYNKKNNNGVNCHEFNSLHVFEPCTTPKIGRFVERSVLFKGFCSSSERLWAKLIVHSDGGWACRRFRLTAIGELVRATLQ